MNTHKLKTCLLIAFAAISFLLPAQDKKISQLPALPSITGGEAIPLAISGTNYYLTPTQLKTWLNIVGYVPLAGTTSGSPLTGTMEFDNSTSGKDFVFWKNVSLGGTFYFGVTDNKIFTSASHGSYSQYSDGQIIQGAFGTSGGQGVLNLTTGGAEISAYGPTTSSRFFQLLGQTLVVSTNTNYAGIGYDSATAGYVTANGLRYHVFHREYNDARYAPISGGAYLSSALTNGQIYVGNGSNIGTQVTPSLNSSAGTFTLSNTGQFTFPDASNSNRGFLNSSDWTTFNNKQDALSGTGFAYQSGTTTTYSTIIAGANGGTGVANTGKTITLGASLTTTGTGAPTLAFPATTSYTYTYPAVSTTVLGQTGTAAANYIPYFNDANQVTSSSNFQFQTFDVGNSGRGLYINSGSTNNFILGHYNSLGYVIFNHPQSPSTGYKFTWRFQNGSDLMSLISNPGSSSYYLGLGSSTGEYIGAVNVVPTAKLQIGSNYTSSGSSTGNLFSVLGATLNDISTAGTFSLYTTNYIGQNTMTATNARTYTDLANFYIAGVNTPSTNVTATRNMALWVGSGFSRFDGTMAVGQNSATYQLDVGAGDLGIATLGKGLRIAQGTNGLAGTVALSSGVATVSISGLTTTDIAQGNYTVVSGSSGLLQYACTSGTLTITSITSGGTSTNTSDNSTVSYFIIRKY